MVETKFLESILEKANELGASDIHISAGNKVGYRVYGKMIKTEAFGVLSEKNSETLFEEMLEKVPEKTQKFYRECIEKEATVGFGLEFEDQDIKYRVNAAIYKEGYYIVLRRNNATPPRLEDLNFYEDSLIGLKTVIKKTEGLFLVVGMTGSGKSTTLAAMIREINENEDKNIITLEDPVEYEHKPKKSNVVQKELGRDLVSFEKGLKAALREDPDIILLGEIRDKVSLDMGLKAAETGHLVFSTLHTDNAVSTIQRIIAMSDNPTLTRDRLSQSLIGVLAQKLIPTPDGKRILLWELFLTDTGIKNNIKEGEINVIKSQIDQLPMSQTFNKTLLQHFKANKLRKEDILKYSPDRESLLTIIV